MTDYAIRRRINKMQREYATSAEYIDSAGNRSLSTSFERAEIACNGITRVDIERAFGLKIYEVIDDSLLDNYL